MKKQKKTALWAAPLVTVGLLLTAFAVYGLFPFGEKSISWCDMNQQVMPLAMQLKDILAGKADFFLNMQNAGGMSFYTIFLFFISSPVFFLMTLLPKSAYLVGMNLAFLLSCAAAALSAAWFIRRRRPGLPAFMNVLLSVSYALSGYTYLYAQNLVWLTAAALLPLLAEGFYQILEKRKIWLYTLSLTAMMVCQFYLSYMVILSLLVVFGLTMLLARKRQQKGKDAQLFCMGSGLAALLSAPVWMPAFLEVQASARGTSFVESVAGCSLNTPLETNAVVLIATGLLLAVLCLGVRYFFSLDGEGLTVFSAFALLCVPLFVEPINRVWHTGSYQAFPCRYGFITIFLGLYLAAIVLEEVEKQRESLQPRKEKYGAVAAVLGLLLVITAARQLHIAFYGDLVSYTQTLWLNGRGCLAMLALFLLSGGIWVMLFMLYRTGWLRTSLCVAAAVALLATECVFHTGNFLAAGVNDPQVFRQITDLEGKVCGSDFYRVKTEKKLCDVNLIGAAGYPQLGHYTSLTGEDYMRGMKHLGYSSYWMEVGSHGGTAFTDALLQNEFIIRKRDELPDRIYRNDIPKILYRNELFQIEKQPYRLPDALYCPRLPQPHDVGRLWGMQQLYRQLGGSGTLMRPYAPDEMKNVTISRIPYGILVETPPGRTGRLQYDLQIGERETLYFDWFARSQGNALWENTYQSVQIFVNGREVRAEYPSQGDNGLVELGTFENQTVQVMVFLSHGAKGESLGLYGMSNAKMESFCKAAKGAPIRMDGNRLTTAYEAEQDGYLLLPLPQREGYTFFVNGKETDTLMWAGCLMAIPISKGENEVSAVFWPQGLKASLCVFALGVLCSLGWLFYRKKWEKNKEKVKCERFWIFCGAAATAGAVIWGYLAPMAIWLIY